MASPLFSRPVSRMLEGRGRLVLEFARSVRSVSSRCSVEVDVDVDVRLSDAWVLETLDERGRVIGEEGFCSLAWIGFFVRLFFESRLMPYAVEWEEGRNTSEGVESRKFARSIHCAVCVCLFRCSALCVALG